MLNRNLVIGGLLICASCAGGEEIDNALIHQNNADPTGSGGQAGLTGAGSGGSAGYTTGAGGSSGASGSNGQSGSSGVSGSGGRGGAPQGDASAGSAGQSNGGSSGAGGAAGGGSGGTPLMSDAGYVAGFQVLYAVQNKGLTSPYIECTLHAKNGGSTSVPVADLKLRYYYTNEVMKTPLWTLNFKYISTSGANQELIVTYAISPLVPAKNNADTYIEFNLSSGSHPSVAPGETAVFSWRMNGPDQSKDIYTQTNDYSFDVGRTTAQQWDHVVLLRNGTVVWGTPPP